MIAWMLYTLIVSVLVVLGARAAESIGRSLGYPVRWVWAGALALLIALTVVAPYRRTNRTQMVPLPVTIRETTGAISLTVPSWTDRIDATIREMGSALNGRVDRVARSVERQLPRRASMYVLVLSALGSTVLLAVFALVQLRFRRARRGWPIADVQGVRVRVAPNVGPVVIGVARPEIVVPHWLLGRSAHEQNLVVAHEAEHVRARDTLLLGAACLVVAAMPWNPAVWYMLSRLRLTVELDCDARVLRGGAAPHSYGALLIDVAENNSGARLSAPALADDSSHLHQRIMAMNATRPRFALARGAVFGALSLVAVLAACEAKMPTSAEVDQMDAASAERAATKMAMLKSSDSTVYIVDGVKTAAVKANRIAPEQIASIEVKKNPAESGPGYIIINTKFADPKKAFEAAASDSEKVAIKLRYAASHGMDTANLLEKKRRLPADGDTSVVGIFKPNAQGKMPLVYVDGVKSDPVALKSMDPKKIESIEVIKGASAAAYVNDPDAVNGVIVVHTKKM
jgi:beta-lactamase regulating signal transducer with metallopeptidase domain